MTCLQNLHLSLDYDVEQVSIFTLLEQRESLIDIYQLDAVREGLVRLLIVLKQIIEHLHLL